MAHKKAQGSSKNNRDSQGKRLGVKVFGGELIRAGGVIVRQRGSRMQTGENTAYGKDYTIYALADGKVSFSVRKYLKFDTKKRKQTVVSVTPVATPAA